ncbi:Thioesterase/thiol ester dehydrase-isomerase [Coniochaeta ligniaria NRRL 30616]|uniref:Thioesterase/thiol ester dehydrase-isomerase n=1 Tax=Coniochaeta ligniaria NRRL 30616 TaxID=1408157 RepID=A0A1J7ITP0_9PEZI|nr:Thioesterase/thiol ester dehydrase-isomerase [Coniochaeta ligniaria NRRL 30616]
MADRPTLMRPPPEDPNKSPIENVLEVTELAVLGPNIFTNTRQPWHPPGARGIYGGAVIAMSLSSASLTVPADFSVHSCHCYFLLAGSDTLPILFHVEKVRDGRSFATRTVQARQKGRCIFTVTASFVRRGAGGPPGNQVRHAQPMPRGEDGKELVPPPDDFDEEPEFASSGPFQNFRIDITNRDSPHAHEKKTRQWVRARGKISAEGGQRAHLNALAYISDSYFIGTISRIHRLWRFPFPVRDMDKLPAEMADHVRKLNDWEGLGEVQSFEDRPEIGMMVSLDHTIYFHEPDRVRADEWMFTEMVSPWAGDGRGVVYQRIFARDGTLIATCVQEGVVRLKDKGEGEAKESKL